MKFTTLSLVAFTAQQVASHATFQALWVNGVDMISFSSSLLVSSVSIVKLTNMFLAQDILPSNSTIQFACYECLKQ